MNMKSIRDVFLQQVIFETISIQKNMSYMLWKTLF